MPFSRYKLTIFPLLVLISTTNLRQFFFLFSSSLTLEKLPILTCPENIGRGSIFYLGVKNFNYVLKKYVFKHLHEK